MSDVKRSVYEGTGCGLIAGTVFGTAQVIATAISDEPTIVAFRRLASILLGPEALSTTPAVLVVCIGIFGHVYFSAMFGMFYGIYNSALTLQTRRSVLRQTAIGPLFGLMLWLVNFHVFVPFRYPWLLALPQLPLAILHAVFFGLPLGLLYATAERDAIPKRPNPPLARWVRHSR